MTHDHFVTIAATTGLLVGFLSGWFWHRAYLRRLTSRLTKRGIRLGFIKEQ